MKDSAASGMPDGAEAANPTGRDISYESIVAVTPLVRLSGRLNPHDAAGVHVYVKCECFNPSGSIKDRMVEYILQTSPLPPSAPIVSASSGNTGAAVAMMAGKSGRRAFIVTSAKCSAEKVGLISAYGADVVVQPSGLGADDPEHYQNKARDFAAAKGYYDLDQYNNPLNPAAYYHTLAPELFKQLPDITHFVAGGSTGGTISGTSRYLKEQKADVRAVLADPDGSILAEAWRRQQAGAADPAAGLKPTRKWVVEGVGKDSVPGAMTLGVVDEVVSVGDTDAVRSCHRLAESEGVLAGGSSGVTVAAALQLAARLAADGERTEEAHIVAILPDSGLKYMSTIYNREWCLARGVPAPPSSDSLAGATRKASEARASGQKDRRISGNDQHILAKGADVATSGGGGRPAASGSYSDFSAAATTAAATAAAHSTSASR